MKRNEKKMDHPRIVSSKEWETARQKLLVKEKELTHARDALAAERRRMPWMAVEQDKSSMAPEARLVSLTCSMAAGS